MLPPVDVRPVLLAVYAVLNLAAGLLFIIDKRRAEKGAWRISERTLLISSFLGPAGAAASMHLAHHKTRKSRFRLVYAFLVLHIVLAVLLAVRAFL